METKNDIRTALQRLLALAERSHDEDWPSAVERDLMLAELRHLYETLLFAAPQKTAEQPAAGIVTPRTEEVAAGVTMVQAAGTPADDGSADIELLDLEDDFAAAPEVVPDSVSESAPEPESAPVSDEPAAETAGDEQPAEPAAAAPAQSEPYATAVPMGESAPASPAPAETEADGVQVEADSAPVEPIVNAGEPENKNLLFDLGTIQHRTHRRMMSLYDDETFDRLPDNPVPATHTPANQAVKLDGPQAAPASESEMKPEPQPVAASAAAPSEPVQVPVEASVEEPAAEYAAVAEPAPAEEAEAPEAEYGESDEDVVVWRESDDEAGTETETVPDTDFGEEDEPEDEPEFESGPEFEEELEQMSEEESASEFVPVQAAGPRQTAEYVQPEQPEPASAPVRTIEELYSRAEDDRQAAQPVPTVLGDVVNSDVEVLGDTMAPQASLGDTLAHAPVKGGLKSALDISERYQIIAELFGGDADACDAAFDELDAMESLEDAVIYIEENFRWNPSSQAAALMMDLLDRKFS